MLQDYYIACLELQVLSMFIFIAYKNEIDGESLATLIGVVPGPNCLMPKNWYKDKSTSLYYSFL